MWLGHRYQGGSGARPAAAYDGHEREHRGSTGGEGRLGRGRGRGGRRAAGRHGGEVDPGSLHGLVDSLASLVDGASPGEVCAHEAAKTITREK